MRKYEYSQKSFQLFNVKQFTIFKLKTLQMFNVKQFMNHKSEIGKIGEDLACEYLIERGYKIVDRNYRKTWGELDIIAKDPANTLVFVEVKTMRQNNSAIAELNPEDNLTAAKLKKLQRTAQMFAGKHFDLVNDDIGWRIDLIAICLPANKITHYKNI